MIGDFHEADIWGIEPKPLINQTGHIAIVTIENLLKITHEALSRKVFKGTFNEALRQYPLMRSLAFQRELGDPSLMYVEKDKEGVFCYDDICYVVAPRVEDKKNNKNCEETT